uniref:Uncharacterized protein n=1 Tax=Noctiluca scintillans TaxID=2966 RepID=A0A7S1F7B3_NOCSC
MDEPPPIIQICKSCRRSWDPKNNKVFIRLDESSTSSSDSVTVTVRLLGEDQRILRAPAYLLNQILDSEGGTTSAQVVHIPISDGAIFHTLKCVRREVAAEEDVEQKDVEEEQQLFEGFA